MRCLDLTSLDEDDTPDRIEALCRRAARPAAGVPPVAAVCVRPAFVPLARERLEGSDVRVACAIGGFPTGVSPTAERVREIEGAVAAGAHEIDTVIDHEAVRAGRDNEALDALRASRAASGTATMKVILETGAAPTLPFVARAARLAIDAGADFLKTSSGFGYPGATPEAVATMCEEIANTDRRVGIKVSGGVRSAADAIGYIDLVAAQLGSAWLDPTRFRIGASALLDALLTELAV